MLIGIFLLVVIGSCGVLLENSFRILFLLFIWFVRIFGIFFDVFILDRILFVVELLYEEICLEILVLVGIVFILVNRVSLFRLLVIDIGLEIFFNILVLFFSVI